MRSFALLILFFCNLAIATDIHPTCLALYKTKGVKPDSASCMLDCDLYAVTYKKDGTMVMCQGYCSKFCKTTPSNSYTLGDLYGLTKKEKELAEREPVKMLKAYKLSHDAESACSELYPSSQTNDESDACRHFVWAALLQNELGTEFASEVLVAHELNPKQPQNQLEMDMHNNKLGREIGQKLNAAKNFSTEKALNAFQENLKAGKIVVIRKGGGSKK